MIPGSNLLSRAFKLIGAQTIVYLAYASRTLVPATGLWVTTYKNPVTIKGSIQPVPRTLMELLGLDMQRQYVNIFAPNAMIDIRRDVTGDQFKFANTTYEALSLTPWVALDGWSQVLCVAIAPV